LRLDSTTIVRSTRIDDVYATVGPSCVTGSDVTGALALKPVGESRNFEPVAGITIEVDCVDNVNRLRTN
jgi:hypothetical protein